VRKNAPACNRMLDQTFKFALIVRKGSAIKGSSRTKAQRRKVKTRTQICFASLRENFLQENKKSGRPPLLVERVDELSFHHAFIGPLDLNAQFLELAVKRGSCETQDVSAFFYIAGGAFEGLHDRFTLNLLHWH